MSIFLSMNEATHAIMQSHLISMTAAVAIPPTKSPITTMQGAQAASLTVKVILKKKCDKGWILANPHQDWSPSDDSNFTPNAHLCEIFANIWNVTVGYGDHDSTNELDSNANMAVVGAQCAIISLTGLHVNVAAYSPDLPCKIMEIVDAAIAYDCPYTLKTTILVIRNSLHIPEMNHNLISPFILREADLQVDEMPKLHTTEPTQEHHIIYDADTELHIYLKLKRILSYF